MPDLERSRPPASYSCIKVAPCSGSLGAEISGVSLASLDDESFEEIHRAWLEHQVLFFRDQRLDPGDQSAFAERFGELDIYPFIAPLPGHPHVIPIIKEKDTRMNFGGGWHSDMSYQAKPVRATCLYAIEVPAHGGDTLFANMIAAYDALSDGMKQLLDGLRGVFTAAKVHGATGLYKQADHPMQMTKNHDREEARHLHPVVRTHPETGRKALYLDLPHVERFENMHISESQPLMEFLYQHATQPQFTTRFRWRPGSLAIWDNRCVQHYALNDYPGQRREMNRVTVQGDVPF
ncbi:MAG: TauD/TfdA family dioxygenase [Myxococcota bacterium]|nr:TauD/TfdA family dioxygenase [Myxococcota bacterium]